MKIKQWALVVCFMLTVACVAQQALTNESIVKMVKAGLSESVIVSMIQSQPGDYTVTPDAVTALKSAGVTGNELAAMAVKGTTVATAEQPQSSVYDSLEIGVYYKHDGQWTMLPSEQVNWKTGGVLKMIATDGVINGDVNGRLKGASSPTSLTTPVQFLIKTPDGVEGTDFTLVYLHQKKHAREFRRVTGGVFHSSSGTQRDAVPFQQKRVARYTYEVILPASFIPGQYAFLAPYGASAGGSSGKAYTFQFDKE